MLESFRDKDRNEVFAGDIEKVKNIIYQNIIVHSVIPENEVNAFLYTPNETINVFFARLIVIIRMLLSTRVIQINVTTTKVKRA